MIPPTKLWEICEWMDKTESQAVNQTGAAYMEEGCAQKDAIAGLPGKISAAGFGCGEFSLTSGYGMEQGTRSP